MKVTYTKSFGHDGTVYTQNLHVSYFELGCIHSAMVAEIAMGLPHKQNYLYTSGNEIYFRPVVPDTVSWDNVKTIELNTTQLRFIQHMMRLKRILDRNTKLIVH